MLDGVKLIQIEAETRYPIVSAYEFEYLKSENIIKERLSGCTIYFILQRRLTYFNNLTMADGALNFEITDDLNPSLECCLDLQEIGLLEPGGGVEVEVQYYKDLPDDREPYRDVAAFKILNEQGEFILWETPQKLIYEVIVNGLPATIEGDITQYLHYHVHYIGRSWSQEVWNRLTGHDNLQKILTVEDSSSARSRKPSFEISLLFVEIVGFDEANMAGGWQTLLREGVEPIVYKLDSEEDLNRFFTEPLLDTRSPQLTAEAEALLIHYFKPEYNSVLFENYPNIKGGTRSVGYTQADLGISKLPVLLSTKHRPASAMGDVRIK